MRRTSLFNDGWLFSRPGKEPALLNVPHTWNGVDGQDGGNNYLRTKCVYTKKFARPDFKPGEEALLEFRGVNSECEVFINGKSVLIHEGGYSTFHVKLTDVLTSGENEVKVCVTNEKNDRVYPQKADFTFYGGIYRDVYLLILPENRLDFGPLCSPPLKVKTEVDGKNGVLTAEVFVTGAGETVITVLADGKPVASGKPGEKIEVPDVRLWNGRIDPYLYTVKAELKADGKTADEAETRVGFRRYRVDPEKGFFLNGESYPLRGVCRHQDRPNIGNALSKAEHDEDMDLISEVGANTVRLAHYQHDQYFYDLCDEKGMVVWAEIPYISQHLPNANENAYAQMRELVLQNFNHASIVCWGISNEITIKPIGRDTVECHQKCHEICHELDPSRLTVVACYMAMFKGNPTAHVSDLVSYNLYFGWYLPWVGLAGWKMDGFRKKYPNTPLGLSEYGAEAMPNLHSAKPRRLDNTEDYQCVYHEDMLKIIAERDYLWATHLWNMFDFAADARNQGGEPGMNHKGLVTFDRKLKKDSFYLYKAFWSKESFVHIAGKRYQNRTGKTLSIKVYSNCEQLTLYKGGQKIETKRADKIFEFTLPNDGAAELTVKCEACGASDTATFAFAAKPDPSYKLKKVKANNKSWEK